MQELFKKHANKLRFGIVGIINTGLDFGILFFLTLLFNLPRELANTISTTISFLFSFAANKNYTFKSTDKNTIQQFILFTVITLFSLWVIQNGIIYIMTPVFINIGYSEPVSLFISKVTATIASLTWNYIFYSKLVFKN